MTEHDDTSADRKRRFWIPIARWIVEHDLDVIAETHARGLDDCARAVAALSSWQRARDAYDDETMVMVDALFASYLQDVAAATVRPDLYASLAPLFGARTRRAHLRLVE